MVNLQLPNTSCLTASTAPFLKCWLTFKNIILGSIAASGTLPSVNLDSVRIDVRSEKICLPQLTSWRKDGCNLGVLLPHSILRAGICWWRWQESEVLFRSKPCFSIMCLCISICTKIFCADKFWKTNLYWHKRIFTCVFKNAFKLVIQTNPIQTKV